jgi:hypothetical protein
MTPLVLLDVDGVLNALGAPDPEVWDVWRRGAATADGTFWPITFAPEVLERLAAWHRDGRVEIQWLTTWGHEANDELRLLLRLPHLDVAGTYQDEDEAGSSVGAGASHAAAAPSAPDPLSGRWWKYDVVRRLMDADPERLLIWVDDELQPRSAFRAWADAQQMIRAVGPDPDTGLTPADLSTVERWLPDAPAPDACRRCGGRLLPIAYGYPGYEMWEAAERGELVLGGCVIFPGQPTSVCADCDQEATHR